MGYAVLEEALVATSATPDFERLCEEEFRVAADFAYENLDREVAGIKAHFGSMGHILSTDLGETVKQAVLQRFDIVLKAFEHAYLDKWREDSRRPFTDEDLAWLNLQVTSQLEPRVVDAEGKCNAYLWSGHCTTPATGNRPEYSHDSASRRYANQSNFFSSKNGNRCQDSRL